jgi:mannose-6-phosphate isomerase-like protein (cupin superfamily)
MPGHLVQQEDVAPRKDADGVETRTTIDAACGCQALVQSVVSFPIGRSQGSAKAGHEQSMFVLSGTATLYLDGLGHHELTPDTAAYLASGESYSIENDGPDPLVALVVDAPTPSDRDRPALGSRKFTVNFATQPDLVTFPQPSIDGTAAVPSALDVVGIGEKRQICTLHCAVLNQPLKVNDA